MISQPTRVPGTPKDLDIEETEIADLLRLAETGCLTPNVISAYASSTSNRQWPDSAIEIICLS